MRISTSTGLPLSLLLASLVSAIPTPRTPVDGSIDANYGDLASPRYEVTDTRSKIPYGNTIKRREVDEADYDGSGNDDESDGIQDQPPADDEDQDSGNADDDDGDIQARSTTDSEDDDSQPVDDDNGIDDGAQPQSQVDDENQPADDDDDSPQDFIEKRAPRVGTAARRAITTATDRAGDDDGNVGDDTATLVPEEPETVDDGQDIDNDATGDDDGEEEVEK